VEDKEQEAGHFLRQYQDSTTAIPKNYPDHLAQKHKNVTIISCSENV
jgi:hypothetical protein